MGIYLTGDTHIPHDIHKLSASALREVGIEQNKLTRDDFIIVLGDFGLFWHDDKEYKYWRKWIEEKPFTVLFLDGNHENHDWLNSMPVVEWNGGNIHRPAPNIIHLMRGQVYNLYGKTFFVMGGARSEDKFLRMEGQSWWRTEEPTYAEFESAFKNLERYNNTVDYVLTHDAPASVSPHMFDARFDPSPTARNLEEIKKAITFTDWYFGHWHEDKHWGKYHCLFNTVVKIM